MPDSRHFTQNPDSRGFVLVGVVIFVLALTILGASLFSLSTYEGQFYGQSSDRAQAFYAAMGGIERAKYILATKQNLTDVWQNGQSGDIALTRARRVPVTGSASDTNGAIVWGQPVDIRVLAVHNGSRRMIEQRFTPQEPSSIYRRLITAYNGVQVVEYEPGDPQDAAHYRPPQTFTDGEVWQKSADTTWTSLAQVDLGLQRRVLLTDVPHPDVAGYRAAHIALAQSIPPGGSTPGNNHQYVLTGPVGLGTTPAFYQTSGLVAQPGGTNNQYSIMDQTGVAPKIQVSGKVVWFLEHGFWSAQTVTVQGLPTDLLIIVSGASVGLNPDNAGIYFQGGFTSPSGVPVLLVSDVGVDIEALTASSTTTLPYLSIFADHVLLGGPLPGNSARFMHPSALPVVDILIDDLYNAGLLPNSDAGLSAEFPPVHRTWREVTDTNPN